MIYTYIIYDIYIYTRICSVYFSPQAASPQALLRASRQHFSHCSAAERHARLEGATLEASASAQDAIAMGTQSGGATGTAAGSRKRRQHVFEFLVLKMNGFIYFWGLRNSLIDWISDANWLELD